MPSLRERPGRGPVDFGVGFETRRDDVVRVAFRVDAFRVVELLLAEQLSIVGMDRLVFFGEVDEPPADADLVSAPGARIPLDRLAEGAGLGLFPRAALAGALAAQAAPERTQAPASGGGIASGPIDVQPGVALVGRARQPGDDAADRAHQVAVFRQGGFRRHGPRAAAVAMVFGTRSQAQRRRRSIRQVERLLATGPALRPAHHRVLRTRERAHVHRYRPLVNRGRLVQHQPFDDLGRDQPVQRFEHRRFGGERLEGGLLAGKAAQEIVGLLVPAQAVSQAVPAGSLSVRAKDGAEQRLHAAGPHQRPRRSRLEPAPVHVRKPRVEVVVADGDGEPGVAGRHDGAAFFQVPDEAAVVAFDLDA